MSIYEAAQQAAKQDADSRRKAEATRRERQIEQTAARIEAKVGHPAVYDGKKTLAKKSYRRDVLTGSGEFATQIEFDTYRIDDVVLAVDRGLTGTAADEAWRLVRDSDDGPYVTERTISVYLHSRKDSTAEAKRQGFVAELGKAMSNDKGHPAAVLRAKNTACPTCHREW